MPVSMYSVSIPVFLQHLNGLSGVLDKAAAWATARKVSEADLLAMRSLSCASVVSSLANFRSSLPDSRPAALAA